ncbi:MAG: ABC transporter permease [Bacteroidetes bacterium]|nr:ABC transporter permease [Bacteroidota bacterium]
MTPYTSHITLFDFAFVGTLFIGLTFALQLWFKKDSSRGANRFLVLALGVMVLWIAGILSADVTFWPSLPQFSLAFGPCIYFYARKAIRPERRFSWKDLFHFSPVLLQQAIWRTGNVSAVNLLTFISVGTYLYLSHRQIERFYTGLKFNEGDRHRYEWRWLQRLLLGLGLALVLFIPLTAIDYFGFHFAIGARAYYPLDLFLGIMVIRMGVVVFSRPGTDVSAEATPFPKSAPSVALKQKGAWLRKKIETGLLYQDPELSVASLAGQLDMPAHELSRIVNIALRKNFADLINEYRIRDVVRKMQNPAYDHITLLGIAYESGFNSKTTFNRTFKQMTGKSPAEYKSELKKERPFSKMERFTGNGPVVLHRGTTFKWPSEKINRLTMFRNYFKMAWRNTLRGLSFSSINMIGLAAALCSFIVILLYMNYELSYDKWSPELNKVYHVSLREHEDFLESTPAPLAGFLAQKYPNVEAATMLQSAGDYEVLVASGDNKFYQKNVVTVDSNFLKVFPYKLAEGNAVTALNDPKAAILGKDLCRKLFGNEDPVGKPIKVYNASDLVVTGVLEEQPGATHLPVAMLMRDPYGKSNNFWGNYSFQTYIKLKHPETDTAIETAINRFYYNERLKHAGISFEAYTKAGAKTNLFVDQVPRMHNFPKHGSSTFTTVTILLVLAVLLLLAGAINFSNLAIARSISRAKEVGIRKVMGSDRKQLILQFMFETALQCLISLVIAVILLGVAMPYINNSFNISLGFFQRHEVMHVALQLAGCLLAIILLSGLYPSVYLSKFNAAKVLKGDYSTGRKGTLLRNGLIVVQFMVSVFFITGIIVIKSQMSFMQTKDKGFSGEQLLRIPSSQATREQGFDNARNMLLSVPGVVSVAKTTRVPGDNLFVDTSTVPFKNNGKTYRMSSVKVSADYFKTLGVPLKAGRLFTNDISDQQTRTAVINQSAAKKMNLSDPVGEVVTFDGCDSIPVKIVGVVKDFNVQGFESAVQPVVYTIGNKACMFQSGGAMLVKLDSRHAQQSIAGIIQVWKKIEPAFPIRYSFVDQNFEKLFISYVRLEKIITFFGLIAILISMMGLFALTAFFTRQRTKEIGVRKVLGASVAQLTTLLSRDFIYLVFISIVIITPFSWWMVQKWLQTFAYRIDISWWIFLAAGLTAIIIAIITVSFQSVKAALANPVKSLRSE